MIPKLRIIRRTSILLILLMAGMAAAAYAGWSEPRRLTYHLNTVDPQVAVNGRNLYVACWGPPGFDFEFLSSWNNGISWSEPIQPADTTFGGSDVPDVEFTVNGLLDVVWRGYFQGNNNAQIFHQSSLDGGRSWTERHRVFNNDTLYAGYPRLASNGDTLFIALVHCWLEVSLITYHYWKRISFYQT